LARGQLSFMTKRKTASVGMWGCWNMRQHRLVNTKPLSWLV